MIEKKKQIIKDLESYFPPFCYCGFMAHDQRKSN